MVIATEMYERGYDVVGARYSQEAAEELVKAAEEGRFPPSAWASEFVQEYYTVEDVRRMEYVIHEGVAE